MCLCGYYSLAAATERLGDLHALSDVRTSLQLDQLRELGTAYAQAMHECQLAAVSGGGDAEYHAAAAAAAAATSGMMQSTAANVAPSATSSSAGSPAASAPAASPAAAAAVPLSAASAAPLRLLHRVEQHVASHDALRTRLQQESLLRTMLPSSTLHPLALQPPPAPTTAAASAADAMDAPMLQSIEALQQLQQSALQEEHKSATDPVALESSAADPASRGTRGRPKRAAVDAHQDAPAASAPPPLLIDATAILQAAAAASNHAASL
jgi:hypothetical protein